MAAAAEAADVFILNTCTVTHIADRKARQAVRAAAKANPNIAVVVTGCYAEREKEALGKLPGVRAVLPNEAKENLAAELRRLGLLPTVGAGLIIPRRHRSLVKIQDGCDHRCAYCVVPLVRPNKSCLPPEAVVARVNERQAEGYREAVLTGTEVGEYSSDGANLAGLIARVLNETIIERLRITSLQPQEVTPELVELWQNGRLCRHFHLSLQSGADAVLRRMRRLYSTADYLAAAERLRAKVPGAAISTDIIVGFPGETEAEFEESYAFIERIGFARLHVFPYSPRPGTAAAGMAGRVDAKTVAVRVKRLLRLGRQCAESFQGRFRGQTLEVLFESKEGDRWVGYTDNYIRVAIESGESLDNHIVAVRLGSEIIEVKD
jgi:threonylcarbamoyladenosine tRNA methylthiotransferase MtaB